MMLLSSMQAIRRIFRFSGPLILQGETAECGLACLANICSAYGKEIDLRDLRRRFPLSIKGTTLSTLLRIGGALDLHTRVLRVDLESLKYLKLPAILHWDLSHFVVLERVSRSLGSYLFHIIDPAVGRCMLSTGDISDHFTGVVIELTPSPSFTKVSKTETIGLLNLVSYREIINFEVFQLLVSAIITQVALSVMPLFMQRAIDTVIPAGSLYLMGTLGLGFLAVLIVGLCASLAQSLLANQLGEKLSYRASISLANRLIALPLAWFEKRQLADIISRLSSIEPITEFFSRKLFAAFIWATGLFLYTILVFYYSAALAVLLAVTISIYATAKYIALRAYNVRNHEALIAQAAQSGMLIENLGGIAAIKAFGAERQRAALWSNARARMAQTHMKLGQVQSLIDFLRPALTGIEELAFVLITVPAILSGSMTIGMVFAVALYRQYAITASTSLIDLAGSFQQLSVHFERISDIVNEPQSVTDLSATFDDDVNIVLDNVTFLYGSGEPYILSNVSCRIEDGQIVAIVGRSGEGKSTLIKIILGLLPPSSGQVMINNVNINERGGDDWRNIVGYVAQDDALFTGSLAENIAFFDSEIDIVAVENAARLAMIHEDIAKMPMKYDTLAGDMGSSLSGGQKARVLLARALYKRPKVLILDEGSAHLDVTTERQLNESLRHLGMTIIMVAHRPETIRQASIIYTVQNGQVSKITHGEYFN